LSVWNEVRGAWRADRPAAVHAARRPCIGGVDEQLESKLINVMHFVASKPPIANGNPSASTNARPTPARAWRLWEAYQHRDRFAAAVITTVSPFSAWLRRA
jgi:hypothetical protein